MNFFPAFLRLEDKPVLVVGGGKTAARKSRALLAAGARLTVVAPAVCRPMQTVCADPRVTWLERRFRAGDVDGHWLAVHATDDATTAAAVAVAAESARVFCNSVDDLGNCSYIVPAVVDRSPLLVAVSSAGTAPVLARNIRARIEAMLPATTGRLAALAGEFREGVAARLRGFAARRYFWERMFDGRLERRIEQGGLSAGRALLDAELAQAQAGIAPTGIGMLVGAGPGDPGLLTLKAMQALQTADVVLHDRLVSDEILALARRDAEFVAVGKTPGCRQNSQEEINALLVERVRRGQRVCRLKGGDPFVFGRGGEEADALEQAGLPYTVVPGITAAVGCAAAAGIPLTHRDAAQSLTLLTGHGKDAVDNIDWQALARGRQTLAIYMGVRRFGDLMQKLTAHGRAPDTPIAIIEHGTTARQRVVRGTLGQLPMLAAAHRIEAPAMLIVGEVARLGRGLSDIHSADEQPPARGSAINAAAT